jgi:competence protein ComEA
MDRVPSTDLIGAERSAGRVLSLTDMRRSNAPGTGSRALVVDRLRYLVGNQTRQPELTEEVEVEPLPPAPRFHRLHLGVVTVLVLIGLLAAGWALLRSRPVAVPKPDAAVTVSTPAPTGQLSSGSAATPTTIVVHVAGAVRRPGLVQLEKQSRVQDAIDAAGGLTRAARPGELNLAQVLSDGQQVLIGTAQHPVTQVREGGDPTAATGGSTPLTAIDLNRATVTELEQLPGVGPVTAANIIGWREQRGRFAAVTELQQVDGIGPKTYARIAPHVRV